MRLLFAGERVRPADLLPPPDVTAAEGWAGYAVLGLEPLVGAKLVADRNIDVVHPVTCWASG